MKYPEKKQNKSTWNLQLLGTAIGTKCPPPFACLTVDYLEEIKLFTSKLPKHFNENECKLIIELSKLYMDDGFILWLLKLNFENFKICLNIIPAGTRHPGDVS